MSLSNFVKQKAEIFNINIDGNIDILDVQLDVYGKVIDEIYRRLLTERYGIDQEKIKLFFDDLTTIILEIDGIEIDKSKQKEYMKKYKGKVSLKGLEMNLNKASSKLSTLHSSYPIIKNASKKPKIEEIEKYNLVYSACLSFLKKAKNSLK